MNLVLIFLKTFIEGQTFCDCRDVRHYVFIYSVGGSWNGTDATTRDEIVLLGLVVGLSAFNTELLIGLAALVNGFSSAGHFVNDMVDDYHLPLLSWLHWWQCS